MMDNLKEKLERIGVDRRLDNGETNYIMWPV